MKTAELPAEGFARLPQVLAAVPVGKSTLWQMVRDGRFPSPVYPSPFGPRVTVWRVSDVRLWLKKASAAA
jgi:predicted DNA-binding transcriptional regulator AlpA